jgi:hypothetical protein
VCSSGWKFVDGGARLTQQRRNTGTVEPMRAKCTTMKVLQRQEKCGKKKFEQYGGIVWEGEPGGGAYELGASSLEASRLEVSKGRADARCTGALCKQKNYNR